MKRAKQKISFRVGFSLAEMLAALVIASMVLIAILTAYNRADNAAASILSKLDETNEASLALQLIAEDLDKVLATAESQVKIAVENKLDNGLLKAQLTITSNILDAENDEQIYEQIIWRSAIDYQSQNPSMILYRSYEGLVPEDKLLDSQRQEWENSYTFIPVCKGLTYFKIEIPRDEDDEPLDKWDSEAAPPGIRITLSFAKTFETVQGTLDVPEEDKIIRTIAIDRTRKSRFVINLGNDENTNPLNLRIPSPSQPPRPTR
jgi:type II secretory pathway pseudopilin PulG